jgi:hypothetical protein
MPTELVLNLINKQASKAVDAMLQSPERNADPETRLAKAKLLSKGLLVGIVNVDDVATVEAIDKAVEGYANADGALYRDRRDNPTEMSGAE